MADTVNIFEQHRLSCPVTLGKHTAMSEEAWLKVCTGARNPRPAFRGVHPPAPLKICGLCKGKHRPKELEIIEMAKGNCESYGEEKNTNKNRGKMMCTSCAALYSAAANRPGLVRELKPELLDERLQVQDNVRELKPELLDERLPVQDNVRELKKQLHEAQKRAALAEEQKQEMLDSLRAALQEYDHDLVAVAERRMPMLAKLEQLYNQADDQVQRMQCEYTELLEKKTKVNGNADSALLDLALDALKGEITGLKPERIEALRGMA